MLPRRQFLSMMYSKKTYMLPNKVKENWEVFSAKTQSLVHDKILRSISQTAVGIVPNDGLKYS